MDIIDDKELEAAWVLREFCAAQENGCHDCKFANEKSQWCCHFMIPPEAWRLDEVAEHIKSEV